MHIFDIRKRLKKYMSSLNLKKKISSTKALKEFCHSGLKIILTFLNIVFFFGMQNLNTLSLKTSFFFIFLYFFFK